MNIGTISGTNKDIEARSLAAGITGRSLFTMPREVCSRACSALFVGAFVIALGFGVPGASSAVGLHPEFTFQPQRLVADPLKQSLPDAAFDGTNYLVVWVDQQAADQVGIRGTRLTATNTVIDADGINIRFPDPGTVSTHPQVAWGANRFMVVWTEPHVTNADIRAAIVLPYGGAGASFTVDAGRVETRARVLWSGTNFLVVYDRNDGRCCVRRFTEDGVPVNPSPAILALGTCVDVAATETSLFIAYNRTNTTDRALYARRFNDDGQLLGGLITVCTNVGYDVRLGAVSNMVLAVWSDGLPGVDSICGARVSADGQALDPAGFAITTNSFGCFVPEVSGLGATFLTSWVEGDGLGQEVVRAARVSPSGMVLDTNGMDFGLGFVYGERGCVLGAGSQWMVAWGIHSTDSAEIITWRVNPAGQVLDAPGRVVSTIPLTRVQTAAHAAWGVTNWLVVWQQYPVSETFGGADIYAARVAPDGVNLDPDGIAIATNVIAEEFSPCVAWGTNGWLVAWIAQDASLELLGVRVAPSGAVLDPVPIGIMTNGDFSPWMPAIAWGTTNWLAVWEEYGHDATDIHGARVSAGGQVLDPGGLSICAYPGDQSSPLAAWMGTNWLVVFANQTALGDPTSVLATFVSPTLEPLNTPSLRLSDPFLPYAWPAFLAARPGRDAMAILIARPAGVSRDWTYGQSLSPSGRLLPGADPDGFQVVSMAPAGIVPQSTGYQAFWLDDSISYSFPSLTLRTAHLSTLGGWFDPLAGLPVRTVTDLEPNPGQVFPGPANRALLLGQLSGFNSDQAYHLHGQVIDIEPTVNTSVTVCVTQPADVFGPGRLLYVADYRQDDVVIRGMGDAFHVAISCDGAFVYVLNNLVTCFRRDPLTQELTLVAEYTAGVQPVFMAISPDGHNAYTCSRDGEPERNRLTVFRRDAGTGELMPIQILEQGVDGVDGLWQTHACAISPDGQHLYVTAEDDRSVSLYRRSAADGSLTYVHTWRNGVDGIGGLPAPRPVEVSPDGAHVYVASFSMPGGLAVFSRNAADGWLTEIQVLTNLVAGINISSGGMDISRNGRHVYVATKDGVDDGVVHFTREPASGLLTLAERVGLLSDNIPTLGGIRSAQLSPDGRALYTAATDSGAVCWFSRDPDTGALRFREAYSDSSPEAVVSLHGASWAAVTPDGLAVYVSARTDQAVTAFRRDVGTAGGLDTDGDGLPDAWESRYYGGITNAVADADDDHDGLDNHQEYVVDSNPTNDLSSAPRIVAMTGDATHTLTVGPTSPDRLYDVYWKTNLTATNSLWQPALTARYGTGSNLVLAVTNSVGQRFERIGVRLR